MPKANRYPLLFMILLGFPLAIPSAEGGGKRRKPEPPPIDGKKVLALAPIEGVSIEMPDQRWHDFGQDFQARLTTRLIESGKFIVTDDGADDGKASFVWPGTFVPAATVRVRVEALSFETGNGGTRMHFGFDERSRNPFNDGSEGSPNDFPIPASRVREHSFGHAFDRKGDYPFDSQSGLDLGEGLSINLLFAWLGVKYASYLAHLNLRIEVDAPLAGRFDYRQVEVKGEGFFFDVTGRYLEFGGGIRLARYDAMLQATRHAWDGAFSAIDRALEDLPLTARIDNLIEDENEPKWLLGTGHHAEIRPGTRYELVEDPSVVIEVEESLSSGSVGRLIAGDPARARPGGILRQVRERQKSLNHRIRESVAELAATESISLPDRNLKKSQFAQGQAPEVNPIEAFFKSLVDTLFLAYRIWRYAMYDQPYHKRPDGEPYSWNRLVHGADWAKRIGLSSVPPVPKGARSGESAPVVAIIDSGVDYNHPAIHGALWLNPSPVKDARGRWDRYGWDFMSGDSRPYDDGYHGTHVASAVLAVAPHARIMPVKAFNPWGMTSSGKIYSSFVYAVDRGADVIVCAWATPVRSRAIEQGIAYALRHGVIVVADAGDASRGGADRELYPAAFSREYENVIAIESVEDVERDPATRSRYAEFSAPGRRILVAEPRGGRALMDSSGLSAALAAGAVARIRSMELDGDFTGTLERLREDARQVPEQGGAAPVGWSIHLPR